ncbi:fatty acid--CoA ligase family protein [Pseudomaricurvus alkylphenolicus]|uniref:FadD3 family acyl-CoA ligase n=1 Tax=Pseudomaricurvus alkylphenolicus TaxID=1306991 RepID=UPI0014220A2F|nr:FadD3 family acyl-CoA ligase [Pseudomaricurvus alkylphenolicus]NIB40334.1 fatty acid--CoA ligase family protein [Pseudomaricurvus alkylphenolicus]
MPPELHPASNRTAFTIPQLIATAAERFGKQLFIEEGETRLSFCDFAVQTRQVAAALIDHGIQPGDRIGVWAPNISEWVIAALGAQCAGAILVTLNTRNKGSETAYILRTSGARLLFSVGNFLDCDYPAMLANEELPALEEIVVFRDSATPHTRWQSFLEKGSRTSATTVDKRMAHVSGDDISDILFTSGTTGNPKGVMTCHAQNLRAFKNWGENVGVIEGDRYLAINPFFHTFGYKAGILVCLIKGVTLLPHAVFDTREILKRIATERISVLPGPPTLFQSLLAHPELDKFDISSLKCTATGAAAIPIELIRQMKDRLGFERVITAYGLTESCGMATMCRPDDSAETIATTSGRAIPDIELRCVDGNNNEVPSGEPGEIVLRGFNVMKGYFDNDAATAETIDSEGWLHTGDIGVMDEQGNLRITDRLKDMFITGGFNCYPTEIENIINGHPNITMNAVFGVPDDRMGEVAMVFVVLKPGTQLENSELISWCREKMANYKVPRQVRFVDALPLNASGKVSKLELKKIVSN